ncbi:MAG: hypothetical protein ABEI86_11905 [Halobacteriaceae archaeon]
MATDTPTYPDPDRLIQGLTVEIIQDGEEEPIIGEIGTIIGEAEPEGALVKLKSGAEGRVRRIVHE